MRTTYGQPVYDLAESFVRDLHLSRAQSGRVTEGLAERIQEAIEDYLEDVPSWICDHCGRDCRDAQGTAAHRCRKAYQVDNC